MQFLEHGIKVAVEGATLVRVLSVTQGGAFFLCDSQRLVFIIFCEPIHDGTVVVRAHAKGVGGKTAAVIKGGFSLLVFKQLNELTIVLLRRHDEHIVEVLGSCTNE